MWEKNVQKNGKAGGHYEKRCRGRTERGNRKMERREAGEREGECKGRNAKKRQSEREKQSENEAGEMPAREEAGERRRVGEGSGYRLKGVGKSKKWGI